MAAARLLACVLRASDYIYQPNTAITPPVLVKTLMAPMFCLANAFWTADMKAPAVPVTSVPVMAAPTASCGWYLSSPPAILQKVLRDSGELVIYDVVVANVKLPAGCGRSAAKHKRRTTLKPDVYARLCDPCTRLRACDRVRVGRASKHHYKYKRHLAPA